jgi:hypothetical protein
MLLETKGGTMDLFRVYTERGGGVVARWLARDTPKQRERAIKCHAEGDTLVLAKNQDHALDVFAVCCKYADKIPFEDLVYSKPGLASTREELRALVLINGED